MYSSSMRSLGISFWFEALPSPRLACVFMVQVGGERVSRHTEMEEEEERHVLPPKEHVTEVANISIFISRPELSQMATPISKRCWAM